MSNSEKIHEELRAAIEFVEEAQDKLAAGDVVVLQELQTNVAQICETIASLPIEQGTAYREQMLELSHKMESLEIDLRAKKIEVERDIKNANSNKNASTAYEKAQNSGDKGKKDS